MTEFKPGDRVKHVTPSPWNTNAGTVVNMAEVDDEEDPVSYYVQVDNDASPGLWDVCEDRLLRLDREGEVPNSELWFLISGLRYIDDLSTQDLIDSMRAAGIRFIREA
jgi:hypothetical protein